MSRGLVQRLRGREDRLEDQVEALRDAADAARGHLDDTAVEQADQVVARAEHRLRITGGHTVVALAGATGSGKSSTFNALTGLSVADVGVRRPTTSHPTACVWGEDPATELLDWLEVPPRHRVSRGSELDAPVPEHAASVEPELDGLVLLDLPDHDSTRVAHHLEVERLVGLADLVVWLLDPQKYADAALHERFLSPMATHGEVFVVVLNRIDEVPVQHREAVLDDVRRLLAADGLHEVPVMGVSALTGEGLDRLREVVTDRVSGKAASRGRLGADVRAAAATLEEAGATGEPRALRESDTEPLRAVVSDAAGVPVVVGAVERATLVRGRQATGWPPTAWVARLRPDPLRRLGLTRGSGAAGQDDVAVIARSSLPPAGHVERARVETALRELGARVADGLPPAWGRAVRTASQSRTDRLEDRLDDVVARTDLAVAGLPWWCRPARLLQWLLLTGAVLGALWLGALAAMSFLQLPQPGTPSVGAVPVPTLLLVGGVVGGLVLALLSRLLLRFSARSRARTAERRLRRAVDGVTDDLVLVPVREALEAHRRCVTAVARAAGRR